MDSLPFDMRTGLWDAAGDNGFAAGLEGERDAIVSLHRYSGLLESGRVHGIGAFGGLVLAACRGKDFRAVLYPAPA